MKKINKNKKKNKFNPILNINKTKLIYLKKKLMKSKIGDNNNIRIIKLILTNLNQIKLIFLKKKLMKLKIGDNNNKINNNLWNKKN